MRPRPVTARGRVLVWVLAAAAGLSLVLLVLAPPARDPCFRIPDELRGVSGFESHPRAPLGVRCRYLGDRGQVVAVVDHQKPLPLVVATPGLALAAVAVAVRRRRLSPA